MSRTIKVFNTVTNSVVVVENSVAVTWSELREEIQEVLNAKQQSLDFNNLKAIAKYSESKASLDFDSTQLPSTNDEGDFKVYLYALKNKSGISISVEEAEEMKAEIISAINEIFSDYGIEGCENCGHSHNTEDLSSEADEIARELGLK